MRKTKLFAGVLALSLAVTSVPAINSFVGVLKHLRVMRHLQLQEAALLRNRLVKVRLKLQRASTQILSEVMTTKVSLHMVVTRLQW